MQVTANLQASILIHSQLKYLLHNPSKSSTILIKHTECAGEVEYVKVCNATAHHIAADAASGDRAYVLPDADRAGRPVPG